MLRFVVDGQFAYVGSANLTGAGLGAKSPHRRNLESGIVATDATIVRQVIEQFDRIWRGDHCAKCDRKEFCDEYIDILSGGTRPVS
ncbi:MAG TPA: phospholipase D-like domain-containing protein [Sedimentisphaerales bacterium]|nr:phospholipase D-like domain-containing protein [Sedimentisphaerales bacterium]HRS10214.1 phospholipase D-like domain-containing protein [Sedimentisphaerales bacterium]HRV46920.1 phospholipase D-like domain-containing protein [Sedimentisphaerales bacterium]